MMHVDSSDHSVVSFEWLQCQLLLGLDSLSPHLVDFHGKDLLGRLCTVDTVCLDRHEDATARAQKEMCIETNNTCLIGLCNISEDAVDHANKHAVLRSTSV